MIKKILTPKAKRQRSLDGLYTMGHAALDKRRHRIALRMFLSGARRGDPYAQNMAGYFFDIGLGVKANRTVAMHWYKLAYKHGDSAAANNIGTIYRDEKNVDRALVWFKRAVALSAVTANLEIAKLLLSRHKNSKYAIVYLKRIVNAKKTAVSEDTRDDARKLLIRTQRRLKKRAGNYRIAL